MDVFETEISFPADEPFFRGHYPGNPVTPGVILIDRAVKAAERMLGCSFSLKGMKKVKFSRPVLPGETVALRLERKGEEEISYSFLKDGAQYASGILVLTGPSMPERA